MPRAGLKRAGAWWGAPVFAEIGFTDKLPRACAGGVCGGRDGVFKQRQLVEIRILYLICQAKGLHHVAAIGQRVRSAGLCQACNDVPHLGGLHRVTELFPQVGLCGGAGAECAADNAPLAEWRQRAMKDATSMALHGACQGDATLLAPCVNWGTLPHQLHHLSRPFAHQFHVVFHQRLGDIARGIVLRADAGHRRHLRRGAGQKHFAGL